MGKTEIISNICTVFTTIIVAIISAVALFKSSKIDNQDRINRSLWVMEEYMCRLGKYIALPSDLNKEIYEAVYMLVNLYADNNVRSRVKRIDEYIEKKNIEGAKKAAIELTEWYSKYYKMEKYAPKKRREIWKHREE